MVIDETTKFCLCPGVTRVNRDPGTSRPCPTCGKARNDDRCAVAVKAPHQRQGCRSVDRAHVEHAILMMRTGQLRWGARYQSVSRATVRTTPESPPGVVSCSELGAPGGTRTHDL